LTVGKCLLSVWFIQLFFIEAAAFFRTAKDVYICADVFLFLVFFISFLLCFFAADEIDYPSVFWHILCIFISCDIVNKYTYQPILSLVATGA